MLSMGPFEGVRVDIWSGDLADLDAELIVVPAFADDDDGDAANFDALAAGAWRAARARGELTGKPWELTLLTCAGKPRASADTAGDRRLLVVGVGPRAGFSADVMRRVAAAGALQAGPRRVRRVAIIVRTPAGSVDSVSLLVQAAADGATLAQLDTSGYKTGPREVLPLESVAIVAPGASDGVREELAAAARRGVIIGESTNDARRLANEPSNRLTPTIFAEHAGSLASGTGLVVDVLDAQRMEALNMGLLLGVARGSAEPPRLITLTHTPANVTTGPVLALVGKGITFDTGGISIKPADGMERMKVDMGGGAAVVAAMRAIARLRVPLRVIGIVPSSENMPGGRALKPGDVLTGAGGRTVEVINTDAEGRLVLADALWYAQHLGATHMVDIATLTGACVVALGRTTTGLFGTPEPWVQSVRSAADRAGERAWPMPLFDDYFDQLKSEVADMANVGGRPAGSVTAAMFLKQFTGERPWAHLDIAGTVWSDDPRPWSAKGATGTGTRTLVELALAHDRWGA
jgi:leucyl aminopeptidase